MRITDAPAREPASVELVWGTPSPRLAQEIAGFWLLHGAIDSSAEVKRRLGEVLLVLRHPGSELVAVTSVYPYPTRDAKRGLAIRAFIDPAHRALPLMIQTLDGVVAAVRDSAAERTALVIVSDNRKLMGPGNRRWYTRRGWRRISGDGAIRDEWVLMVGPGTERPPQDSGK